MLMPFLPHPPPIMMHQTWMVRCKTWFACKLYVILHVIGRSAAISEGSKNVGDQVILNYVAIFNFDGGIS